MTIWKDQAAWFIINILFVGVCLYVLRYYFAALKSQKEELQAQNEQINAYQQQQDLLILDLLNSQKRYHSLLETMGDCFYSLDWHWRFKYVNHKAKTDIEREGHTGRLEERSVWDLFPEMMGTEFYQQCFKTMYKRVMTVHEAYVARTQTWYEFRMYPNYEGISVFYRDISAQKKAELQLQQANEKLQAMVYKDGLTGVYNRRYFDQILEKEWKRSRRYVKPLSLILFDIDYFKPFNDQYGHLTGDACLQQIARAMNGSLLRPGDKGFRYGGEEFAVLLPDTGETGSLHVAERIRQTIEELRIPHERSEVAAYVTGSFGVAIFSPDSILSAGQLVKAADLALYESKRLGRNTVTFYSRRNEESCADGIHS